MTGPARAAPRRAAVISPRRQNNGLFREFCDGVRRSERDAVWLAGVAADLRQLIQLTRGQADYCAHGVPVSRNAMRAITETRHQESALSRYGGGRLAAPRGQPTPGSNTTTNPTQEPNNVREYRFVKEYPPISGVKSSQSGNSSHCSSRTRTRRCVPGGHSTHFGHENRSGCSISRSATRVAGDLWS
jgi:hypothetical protein